LSFLTYLPFQKSHPTLTFQLFWGSFFKPQFTPAEKTIHLGPGRRPHPAFEYGSPFPMGGPHTFFQPILPHFLNTVFNSFKFFASRRFFWAALKSSIGAMAGMSTSGADR
jgi:hypothetical protein